MMLKLLMLINLLGYAFVVSQPLFYLLAMGDAQKRLQAPAYVELRNLLDSNLMVKNRIVYYAVLVTSPLTCIFNLHHPEGLLFITSVIACVALWIDVYLMFKGNLPLNRFIQTWTPHDYPPNWERYRALWFSYYHRRQVACMIGFTSLVIGLVFG
jgi:uncharacterized membrane protein